MAKRKLLNVKSHLEHVRMILQGLKDHGHCPAIERECRIANIVNKAILKKHTVKGTRKDLYVGQ